MTDEQFTEHCKRDDRRAKTVFVFPGGNIAVTDQFGQQMPELQAGFRDRESQVDAIRAVAHSDIEWLGMYI